MGTSFSAVGVTGASGMVGRQVLRLLGERAVRVCATSRREPDVLPEGVASVWQYISADQVGAS